MASIPPEVARAVVLRHFPRILRAGLDPAGRNGSMPMQLAQDAAAIRPIFGRAVRTWLARPYLHNISEGNPEGLPRKRGGNLQAAELGFDPMAGAIGSLRTLDAHAAHSDLPALREIADSVLLLGFSANVESVAARVAAAVWPAIDRLGEVGAVLRSLALVSAGAATDDDSLSLFDDDLDGDPDDRYGSPAGSDAETAEAAARAWEEQLGKALNILKSEASNLAVGLAAMGTGRTLPYHADSTLAAHAIAVGLQETALIERRLKETMRRNSRPKPAPKPPKQSELAAATVETGEVEPSIDPDLVVVCPSLEKTGKSRDAAKGYEHVIDTPLPLVRVGELAPKRAELIQEFPYAVEAIDTLLGELVGKEFIGLPAFLIEGRPGAGKSRLVRRLGEVLGVGTYRVDATADGGASIAGTERRWFSTEPCRPFMAIARYRHANPFLAVDEVDKAPTRNDYGRVWDALLQLLEPENASRYPDPSLQVELDISHVSILCLANDASRLPGPLLDRLRIVRVPEPSPEHLNLLLPSVVADIARERRLDPRFFPPPDGVELAALRRRWRGGSVRRLRRAVEAVLRAREKMGAGRLQ